MNKISTAEELLMKIDKDERLETKYQEEICVKAMIEFAKLHVEAALKEVSKKTNYPYRDEFGCHCDVPNIVLNAYPLDLIK